MIAQALALDPKLLIADEPTTALDVTVQAEILKLVRDLRDRIDAGILLITHDMGVVADLSDRVLVMQRGRIVESRDVDPGVPRPEGPLHAGSCCSRCRTSGRSCRATSIGRAARRPTAQRSTCPTTAPTNLVVDLQRRRHRVPEAGPGAGVPGRRRRRPDVGRGEVVGLVGESGSGKTTIGRAIVGLLPFVEGTATVLGTDMVGISKEDLRQVRRDVSFVFQDPGSSLNPRLPVGESIGEPLLLQKVAKGAALEQAGRGPPRPGPPGPRPAQPVPARAVGRSAPARRHRPGAGARPALLIADEPTSALDVSVQARVLDLFQELQREIGFACLFISHDLAVVEILAQRIAVMENGKLVEFGTREQILTDPQELYTKRLLAAVPVPGSRRAARAAGRARRPARRGRSTPSAARRSRSARPERLAVGPESNEP